MITEDSVIAFFGIAIVLMLVATLVWATAIFINDVGSGEVVEKYYDDKDVVCSKGCVIHKECYALVIEGEPWFDNRVCVSKAYYDTVSVGDYYTTGE